MAGVTDRPFRSLCRSLGAGLVVSEMIASDSTLWQTEKSRLRRDHAGEAGPIAVQIAGYDPAAMAEAAQFQVAHGAQIVDINMGCPARKVCRVDAGSALMRDEALVARILSAVVRAVAVPVTLKIRSGWAAAHRNAPTIARIAEDSGIAALTVHGRTREMLYTGQAEYETVAAIKRQLRIPVIANGDIDSPERARDVFQRTGVDAVMIGRAALGRPWIFTEIVAFLAVGCRMPEPPLRQVRDWLLQHLDALHAFYGEGRGVRVARKHIQWYCAQRSDAAAFWTRINRVDRVDVQRAMVIDYFDGLLALPAAG